MMQQKNKNHQNQESIDKKMDFLVQFPSHLPRWGHLVQKTRAKNSHVWAPDSFKKILIIGRQCAVLP
jgi:hypothetical protein